MFMFAVPFRIWFLLMLVIAAVVLAIGLVRAIRTEVWQRRVGKRRTH
jgi:uncharacterized membrane protein